MECLSSRLIQCHKLHQFNCHPRLIAFFENLDVFGRPMGPFPAPLVYINGRPGVVQEAVADFLTSRLGADKSLVIDVRHRCSSSSGPRQPPILPSTPEHPGYLDFSADSPTPIFAADVLAHLLALSANVGRIAILVVCAVGTGAGWATVRDLQSAADITARLFVPVTLACQNRTNILQRQCGLHKTLAERRPGPGSTLRLSIPQVRNWLRREKVQ